MSASKKHKCICISCGEQFRSKEKFKELCPKHSKEQVYFTPKVKVRIEDIITNNESSVLDTYQDNSIL